MTQKITARYKYCERCGTIVAISHIHYERPRSACDVTDRDIDNDLADDAVAADEGDWRVRR